MMKRIEDLPELRKKRKVAAVLWYVQGDAAAKVGAEVDSGGGALKTGRREEDEAEGVGGKEKGNDPSVLFIKKGICQARESRSREFGNKAAASIVAGLLTG